MKKSVSVILAVLMCVLSLVIPAAAADALPESEHDYANNCFERWDYTYPEQTKAILVTFSEDTYVEAYGNIIIPDIDVKSAAPASSNIISIFPFKTGDYIAVYGANDKLIGTFDGDELAGRTLFIEGNSFSVILSSDQSVTGYGFKVTDVSPCPAEDISEITYVVPGRDPRSELCYKAEKITVGGVGYYASDDIFCGWSTEEGGAVEYDAYEEIAPFGGELTLYACFCKTLLSEDEILWFNNSSWYFDVDGEDRYYMTPENYRMMQLNLYKNYGLGPIPGPIVSLVLTGYPNWEFRGSCYGMSTVTALQHFGYIDVPSVQNVQEMYDLDPDCDLISYINYYQAQAASSYLCENAAAVSGSLVYKQALKSLYDTVTEGNLSMLTFYQGAPFVTVGHTVLITGAYTNAAGEHVLITYDCNHPSRYPSSDIDDAFVISPNWSSITYEGDKLGAINWTDDFTHFRSFDIEGKGTPIDWYVSFFRHIADVFTNFFRMFRLIGK